MARIFRSNFPVCLGFLLLLACQQGQHSGTPRTPAPVLLAGDDALAELEVTVREALLDADMTRCALVFGVLIAADSRMPEAYFELAAGVLAELLDRHNLGLYLLVLVLMLVLLLHHMRNQL